MTKSRFAEACVIYLTHYNLNSLAHNQLTSQDIIINILYFTYLKYNKKKTFLKFMMKVFYLKILSLEIQPKLFT